MQWHDILNWIQAVQHWFSQPMAEIAFQSTPMQELTFSSVLLRLSLSVLLGGAIGLERARKNRAAGFRTYMLVCMGATLAMILGQYLALLAQDHGLQTDMSRIGSQVINGIGFLGAGTILVTDKQQVKGLTTAAGLWACAIIGLAIGAGFLERAAVCAALVLLAELLFVKLEYRLLRHSKEHIVYIEYNDADCLEKILACLRRENTRVNSMEVTRSGNSGGNVILYVHANQKKGLTPIFTCVSKIPGVLFMEEL